MINVFTLTNINTKIIEGKFSKILFQKCVSNWLPFALIDRQEVARSFKKVSPFLLHASCLIRFFLRKMLGTRYGPVGTRFL